MRADTPFCCKRYRLLLKRGARSVTAQAGLNAAVRIAPPAGVVPLGLYLPATHVCCVAASRRVLTFPISELKVMAGGGRGLMLMDLDKKDSLAGAAAYTRSVKITGVFRDKEREEVLEIRSLNNAMASRGRKGKDGSFTFKPVSVERVE